jgi:hypothetical protein
MIRIEHDSLLAEELERSSLLKSSNPANDTNKSDLERIFGASKKPAAVTVEPGRARARSVRKESFRELTRGNQYVQQLAENTEEPAQNEAEHHEFEDTPVERIVDLLIVTGKMSVVGDFADFVDGDTQKAVLDVLRSRVSFQLTDLIKDTPPAKVREGYTDHQAGAAWLIGLRGVLEYEEYIAGLDKDLHTVDLPSISEPVHMHDRVNELVARQLASFRESTEDLSGQEPFVASRQFCAVIQKQLGENRFGAVEHIALELWLQMFYNADVIDETQYGNLKSLASVRGVKLDPDKVKAIDNRISNEQEATVYDLYAQLRIAVITNNSDKIVSVSELLLSNGESEEHVMNAVRELDYRKQKTNAENDDERNENEDENDENDATKKRSPKSPKKQFSRVVSAMRVMKQNTMK